MPHSSRASSHIFSLTLVPAIRLQVVFEFASLQGKHPLFSSSMGEGIVALRANWINDTSRTKDSCTDPRTRDIIVMPRYYA